MSFETGTRALILACFVAAPLLAGADGGCGSGDPVSIGGLDDAGAGTGGGNSGSGGSGQGVPCGPTHCASGFECCNASCGFCTAPGEGCRTIGCIEPCAAQAAAGVGACDLHLGFAWNGSECVPLGGCSCEGPACAGLYASAEQCQAAHSNCNAPCALPEQALVSYLRANTACASDADCRTVSASCSTAAHDCSGTFYTNQNVDNASVAELQKALNECVGEPNGCPQCDLASPAPACVAGSCTARGSSDALEQQIRAEVERLNGCESVDECVPIAYGCSSLFINEAADHSQLDELIRQHREQFGGGTLGCPAVCACGVLECTSGKCTASPGDCMTAPPGGELTCL